MQPKFLNDQQLGNDLFCHSFAKQGLDFHDFNQDQRTNQQIKTIQSFKTQASLRGKGRPKGEKNSKLKEKKSSTSIADENRRRGHWSLDENKKYHWFLEIYNKHFICKQMRRLDKIFKTMAIFIGTREAEQCRSHHQKMQKKYHSFPNIILYLRKIHYGCEDSLPVEEDMLRNDIKQTVSFIDLRQQKMEESKKIPPTPSVIEQAKLDSYLEEPIRQIQLHENIFDLLGQDYEQKFSLNNLLF